MNPSSAVLSLLALASIALAQDAPTHTLQTNADKGSSVWLQEETRQKQTIDMAGQEMQTSNTIVRILRVTVLDVADDGSRTVETEVMRVRGKLTLPMLGDFEFDSAGPATDTDTDDMGMGPGAMIEQLQEEAGRKFVAEVGADGRVAGSLDEQAAEMRKQQPQGSWTGNAMKSMVETAFGRWPTAPLAIGGKWQFVTTASSGLPITQTSEAVLTKVDDEAFDADFTGTLTKNAATQPEADATAEGADMADMVASMTIKNGKLRGAQRVSRKDGFVVTSKSNATADITMETPMGEMAMAIEVVTSVQRTTEAEAMPKAQPEKKEPAKDGAGK